MPTDLTIELVDRPGTLAELGESLGRAGINIEGGCGFSIEGKGIIHILVEDAEVAKMAVESADLQVLGEREVLVVEIEDAPGELGKVTRKVSDAGVNMDLIYLSKGGKLILGVDDMETALSVI
ncbi:MAG: amino acid-binding protein [Anaerolineales bacterium]|jgi:hypothetical protein